MSNEKMVYFRNLALGLGFFIIVGWSGYVIGKYDVKNYKDLLTGLKGEFTSAVSSSETVSSQNLAYRKSPKKDVDMGLFWMVWDKLESQFLFQDKIDHKKMVLGAISGMTSSLGDPYTAFYPPTENKISKENLNGSFGGVGIQLGYKKGDQLAVMSPIAGMPAEKAGVKAGDFILHIKDEKNGFDKDTFGMSLMEAVEKIRGEIGTSVTLTLLREGESKTYEVTLKREDIIVPSVELKFGQVVNGEFKEGENGNNLVAHLMLTRFGDLTDDQWDDAVTKIVQKGDKVSGVVLDLRNNPGGYMQGAVTLLSEFFPKGKMVLKQDETGKPTIEFTTQRTGRLMDIKLVVLQNQGSASASEIMAGALKDYKRAKLVGTKSFGKGTIQIAEDLPGGAGLHVTIAKWLTPEGTWVHEKGLEPDVEIAVDANQPKVDVQLNKAASVVLEK